MADRRWERVIACRGELDTLAGELGVLPDPRDDQWFTIDQALCLIYRLQLVALPPWSSRNQLLSCLRELSQEHGLTPALLSEVLGVNDSTAGRYLAGGRGPSFARVAAWAGLLEDMGATRVRLRVIRLADAPPSALPRCSPRRRPLIQRISGADDARTVGISSRAAADAPSRADVPVPSATNELVRTSDGELPATNAQVQSGADGAAAPAAGDPATNAQLHSPAVAVPATNAQMHTPASVEPAMNAQPHPPATGAPATNAQCHPPAADAPASNAQCHPQAADDPATNAQHHPPAADAPATNAQTHAQATDAPASNAQLHPPAAGAPATNARITMTKKKSTAPKKRRLTIKRSVPQVEAAMVRVEWRAADGTSWESEVSERDLDETKRGIAANLHNPMFAGRTPYINGERFDPSLYRLEVRVTEREQDMEALKKGMIALQANVEGLRANFMSSLDAVGNQYRAIRDLIDGSTTPPGKFVDLAEKIINNAFEQSDKKE